MLPRGPPRDHHRLLQQDVIRMVDATREACGGVDVLVNNAGI